MYSRNITFIMHPFISLTSCYHCKIIIIIIIIIIIQNYAYYHCCENVLV